MASPLVGVRTDPCPHCGSAEVYLRTDGAPQCKECQWTGPARYDSKYLQSWSTVFLPPSRALPAPEASRLEPKLRRAGGLLIGGAVAHVLAIFLMLNTVVSIPRLELLLQYRYLDWTTVLGLPVVPVGILLQALFAVVGILGAVVVLGGYEGGGPVFGTVGLVAVLVSVLLFGGLAGVVAGALLAGAGVILRPSSRTSAPAAATT